MYQYQYIWREKKMYHKRNRIIRLFDTESLIDQLDPNEPFIILAKEMDWDTLEKQLMCFYDLRAGSPALPIRLMAGLTIIKYKLNLSDEKTVIAWKNTPCLQAFTGSSDFTNELPCHSSTLARFRRRIGEKGAKIIFNSSVLIHGDDVFEEEVVTDATAQPKYTIFPTDIGLAVDVIEATWNIASKLHIKFRNKHANEVKKLKKAAAFDKSNNRQNIQIECRQRLRAIALELLKELQAKVPHYIKIKEQFIDICKVYEKAVTQEKNDKNKIYSIYEPQIYCIAKGKAKVKFEFGTKVSIMVGSKNNVIYSVISGDTNCHDSKFVQPHLDDIKETFNFLPSLVIGDQAYKYLKIDGITIVTPHRYIPDLPLEDKKTFLRRLNRRSSVEQIISHQKNDYKLGRNTLKDSIGDKVNPFYSAAAYNFSLFIRQILSKKKKKLTKTRFKLGRKKPSKTKSVPFALAKEGLFN
jgi:IS5 family transposase